MSTYYQLHKQKVNEINDIIKKLTKKVLKERIKEFEANKQRKKQKQISLTNNLKQAYNAIKPTIIQAQRILKIVENLEEKIALSKYLNYDFMKFFVDEVTLEGSGLDLNLVESLKPRTRKYLETLSRIQQQIFMLKDEDFEEESELDDMEEGEEESEMMSRRDDDEDSERDAVEEENEEDRLAREERVRQANELGDQMSGIFRNLIRFLLKNKQDVEIIKVSGGLLPLNLTLVEAQPEGQPSSDLHRRHGLHDESEDDLPEETLHRS